MVVLAGSRDGVLGGGYRTEQSCLDFIGGEERRGKKKKRSQVLILNNPVALPPCWISEKDGTGQARQIVPGQII